MKGYNIVSFTRITQCFATIPWRDEEDRPYKQKAPQYLKIDIVGLSHYILTYILSNVLYNPRSVLAHYNLY